MSRKALTTEEFISKAKLVHGDKYDYSLSQYINCDQKLIIICKEHGNFKQTPYKHLTRQQGCPICGHLLTSKKKLSTTEIFIKKAKKIHGNKYGYEKTIYIGIDDKIIIKCSIHGDFKQVAYSHINGYGCAKCSGVGKLSTNEFINQAMLVHGNKYDYSKANYINAKAKINIICPLHGEFKQTPNQHKNGSGCPICNESKGERETKRILTEQGINFKQEHKFLDCKNIKSLPFDFYLPDYNICIEYDGEQHFKPVKMFGGNKKFKITQTNDRIKTNYCFYKDIVLIRISYKENIFKKLSKIFIN